MTLREKKLRIKLRDDFPAYARQNLKIRAKGGKVSPFVLNTAQKYIHERLENQLKETGKIRAIVLKGRQQGASTYIEGRYYWRVTHRKGVRAYILTHEDEATKNLFEMAARYHEHCNILLKPHTKANNAKELFFDRLDSGYRVGTAKTKGTGRSGTFQFFHGSEVAFWAFADTHAKGVMQAIPDEDGTEAILESTANGFGNFFHQQWKQAEAGISEYIAIFIPWYWQEEYKKVIPKGFTVSDEEQDLKDQYGLNDEQIFWRRLKIVSLSANGADGLAAFKQEYPCNASEAFQTTGQLGLITPDVVMKARKAKVKGNGPYVVGVDPSRGGDRFSTIKRQGRKAYGLKSYIGGQVDKLGKQVSICKKLLDTVCAVAGKKPDMMFIDAGGGADLVDRLHELGYSKRVKAIQFGGRALDPEKYPNRRSEMWGVLNLWLRDENLDVEIPDDDTLHADLCASLYSRDTNDRICLLKKDKIKAELGFSPDEGDALALTHAEPVRTSNAADPYKAMR